MIISAAESELASMLHGTNPNDITDINGLYTRAARNVLTRLDPDTTRRIANLTNAVHDDVYQYAVPSDLKGRKVIDIRPQVRRDQGDNFSSFLQEEFDMFKASQDDIFSVIHNDGTKFIRISKDVSPSPKVLHSMESLTTNGTWSAVGSAANLSTNSLFYVSGAKSIEFDLVATGDGIENSTMSAVNLTDHDEVGTLFVWVYLPATTDITSFTLLWGNDLTANYWSRTVTTQWDTTAFRAGWNLLGFNWADATETGTVAPATIDSLRLTIAGTTAINNIRVDNITASIGQIFEMVYYSKFLFRSAAGVWKESPSEDDDVINLDTDALNIWLFECAILGAQAQHGEDMAQDVNFFKDQLFGDGGLYDKYKASHMPEAERTTSTYYRV